MPQLTIQIVGWNSANVLPAGLAALDKIPANEVVVHYIDNHSTDNSVELVRQLLPSAHVTELPHNVGYARAHNEGLRTCTTPFVLFHDPDVTLNWQGISSLLKQFDDPRIGALQGKLLRSEQQGTRTVIDSTGIILSAALNGIERGSNTIDFDQYRTPSPVAAVTGACGLFRLAALKSVAYSADEYLDNDFFSYKEDVDIGWRLTNAGWQVWYHPIVAGVHVRTLGRRGAFNWGLQPQSLYQRLRSPRTRYSLRNWVWLIIKNASPLQLLIHAVPIAIRAIVFFGLSILYPPLIKVWFEIITGIPTMLSKRFSVSRPAVVPAP